MTSRVWKLSDARTYNVAMDRLLARSKENSRELQQIARRLSGPARALLDFVYLDLKANRRVPSEAKRSLTAALEYSPLGWRRLVLPPKSKVLSASEIQKVQQAAQEWLARLVLNYDAEEGWSVEWRLPKFEAHMVYLRVGIYALYDLSGLEPQWMRHALTVGDVLSDAVSWLRFCDLCGRLFFKVKRKRWCSHGCGSVYHSRRQAKGSEFERRGPQPKAREAPYVAAHSNWLRMAWATGKLTRS